MRLIAKTGVAGRVVACALSIWLTAVPALGAGPASSASVAGAGTLSIATDPAGATVYIDGRASGVTPLSLSTLTPGDHRVRLTKDGFLENTRLIHVVSRQASTVRVTLTRRAAAADTASQASGGGVSTSSSSAFLQNPIFLVGFAAVGAGAAVALLKNNVVPQPGTFTVTPPNTSGLGVASVTEYQFTASGAVDFDDDPLIYSWNFGDGRLETGATVRHTFATAGTYTTTLTVSDGEHSVPAGSQSLTVRQPLTGTWGNALDPIFSCPFTVSLVQTGRTLSGSIQFSGGCTGTAVIQTGSTSSQIFPTGVTWQTSVFSLTFAGTVQSGLSLSFNGQSNGLGTTMNGPLVETQPGTSTPPAPTNFIKQ